MTITLETARTRVRNHLDDNGGGSSPRWSDTEIDAALEAAQLEVMQVALASGSTLFRVQTTVSCTANGLVDLTSVGPMRIVSVMQVSGEARFYVPAVGTSVIRALKTGVESLQVTYVPRPSLPAQAANTFTWGGSSISRPEMDQLMVAIAAGECLVKSGVVNGALETRKAELRQLVEGAIAVPGFTALPTSLVASASGRLRAGFQWAVSAPDTLQLVYA